MEGSARMKMDGTDTRLKSQELLLNDLYIDPVVSGEARENGYRSHGKRI